ncbi:cupredoxin domain-containing protein [Paenibacillus physcomitrellae]|uniref:cupredoxin domain-containing protein n=1 Tax=Paenibacillus physcomitrellae TaxID=1619311 RepID=UPI0012FD7C37|nr:cupredoxin domain-containing protein [Paenibacillus physcomitrellae]
MKKLAAVWPFLTVVLTAFLFGGFALFYIRDHMPEQPPDMAVFAQSTPQSAQSQIVTVDVRKNGFFPNHIEVQAGTPVLLNFKKEKGISCIRDVASLDLDMNVYLKKGDNYYTLDNLQPGNYEFHCGMYMYSGTVTVK